MNNGKFNNKRHYSTFRLKTKTIYLIQLFILGFIGLAEILYLYLESNVLIIILMSPLPFIASFLFTSSLVLLDDFKFSDVRLLKFIQIFSIIFVPLCCICYLYYMAEIFIDIVENVKENNDINLHRHVSLDK